MQQRKKSWREKLQYDKGLPKVVKLCGRMAKAWGQGTMVVPLPREVAELVRKVPKGKLTTINELRRVLAARHGTDHACPIVTGISVVMASRAAAEDEVEAKRRVLPYWRTLKAGGELNPKYPGGVENQRARLEAEGHTVICKGQRCLVANYQARLTRL